MCLIEYYSDPPTFRLANPSGHGPANYSVDVPARKSVL